ncbi:A/G-specific adenine glycosylase [Candidatus Nitrotoga sp. M5]|uniref:A/G-specific adenine glycosylase n=1 Tax=Candidatus Nitrotoga sp. M5 TaxID=2890409 RepID=UPI001FA01138|nr:A/G-specific adenine glycosylase [Candidatus Nitrotoga sp. M5]CAH1387619.1 Adenine DNA glycosylase [Candidatus Nitrotoga sp. M5]
MLIACTTVPSYPLPSAMEERVDTLIKNQSKPQPELFAHRIIDWQQRHGRHGLPWQGEDVYHIWLSEIMLQQTQVITVIPYYLRFVASFPTIAALAADSEEAVLEHWSGLGYYSRARNLHRTAQLIMQQHEGKFPKHFEDILALPGIGRSTAAAISAFAFHERRAILDGNVKRLLARYHAVEGYTGEKKIEAQLWQQAEALLPQSDVAIYTQGLMDLGALICTRSKPQCPICPLQKDCKAYQTERVAQLPTPRPRKVLPEKHSTFLLLLNGPDILLEKRPGSGIWGGLWCLPQIDSQILIEIEDAGAYCLQQFCMETTYPLTLSTFTHTFTHFKLHITPLLLQVINNPKQIQEPGRIWLDVTDALQAAIPTPVRKLLRQIQAGHRVG